MCPSGKLHDAASTGVHAGQWRLDPGIVCQCGPSTLSSPRRQGGTQPSGSCCSSLHLLLIPSSGYNWLNEVRCCSCHNQRILGEMLRLDAPLSAARIVNVTIKIISDGQTGFPPSVASHGLFYKASIFRLGNSEGRSPKGAECISTQFPGEGCVN